MSKVKIKKEDRGVEIVALAPSMRVGIARVKPIDVEPVSVFTIEHSEDLSSPLFRVGKWTWLFEDVEELMMLRAVLGDTMCVSLSCHFGEVLARKRLLLLWVDEDKPPLLGFRTLLNYGVYAVVSPLTREGGADD